MAQQAEYAICRLEWDGHQYLSYHSPLETHRVFEHFASTCRNTIGLRIAIDLQGDLRAYTHTHSHKYSYPFAPHTRRAKTPKFSLVTLIGNLIMHLHDTMHWVVHIVPYPKRTSSSTPVLGPH